MWIGSKPRSNEMAILHVLWCVSVFLLIPVMMAYAWDFSWTRKRWFVLTAYSMPMAVIGLGAVLAWLS
jgi:hypothetical protein